jgi:hypothetical protein
MMAKTRTTPDAIEQPNADERADELIPSPEPAAPSTVEIVSFRDELPCGDGVLARGQKLGTITLEPGVPLGFFTRAIEDSLAGQATSL